MKQDPHTHDLQLDRNITRVALIFAILFYVIAFVGVAYAVWYYTNQAEHPKTVSKPIDSAWFISHSEIPLNGSAEFSH